METFDSYGQSPDLKGHGQTGPFHASVGGGYKYHPIFEADCLSAVERAGIPRVADAQNLRVSHGISVSMISTAMRVC
jgi:hypothetical protein